MSLQRYSYFASVCNLDFPNYKNLSGGGDHGFNSGLLGEFIDHKKGIRKHLGLSYEKIPGMNTQLGDIVYKIIFGVYIRLKKFKYKLLN